MKTWKCLMYFTWGLEAKTDSLTQQYTSPTGEEIRWRLREKDRLQVSHADTSHAEHSYTTLHEANSKKSGYIRVTYRAFQPGAEELDNPQALTEEENVAKMVSHNIRLGNNKSGVRFLSSDIVNERNQQERLVKHFHCNALLRWATFARGFFRKMTADPFQGHKVECNHPKTEKTKIIKHSTSYFPGTGKRHGLVVVSGNGTQGNPWGERLKATVWISISEYFEFFPQAAGMKWPSRVCLGKNKL